jgi:hypothetical protein
MLQPAASQRRKSVDVVTMRSAWVTGLRLMLLKAQNSAQTCILIAVANVLFDGQQPPHLRLCERSAAAYTACLSLQIDTGDHSGANHLIKTSMFMKIFLHPA